ncbi:MAG: nitrile hydratase subunit alpha [Rhodospirillaceae bacterium]|nr:nitrile hydratase subunit alpha [Rhodospirillaceae bacterium]MBT5191818.1 nitrile hydratase subunit alpha [Rhodospirillaceae bacterium]MBT5456984.1 nitrile hydratase subunit alpha [Rhodospirillaceae bacterium]MBT5896127.1 nitrile hydratase subunit alpha [Rhodospirillaceae bacterium]
MTEYNADKIGEIHRHLHSELPSEPALRVKALESVLVEKELFTSADIDKWVDAYTEKVGPINGGKVVARAWVDAAFKARLLADGTKAFDELGFKSRVDSDLKTVENTASVQNLVVCTLCSCYPLHLLGMSPTWYKSNEYRARAVRDPRGVLREFGVEIDDDVEVRVWDSTSERRFLVLPQRPPGTETWPEDKLARLVTRNAMIGTQRDLTPESL